MFENPIVIALLLVSGILPITVQKVHGGCGQYVMSINAVFWSLTVRGCWCGRRDWHLRIMLIERLKAAIWAAILRLSDQDKDKQ